MISERMVCKQSAIFFGNLAVMASIIIFTMTINKVISPIVTGVTLFLKLKMKD